MSWYTDQEESGGAKCIGIIYSSGDLGDVGRHAVEAALQMPSDVIHQIKVFSINCRHSLLQETDWKCGCPFPHGLHYNIDCLDRIQLINIDCTKDDLSQHLQDVDAVISCLGNRNPFLSDCIAKRGTQRIIQAMRENRIHRIVMLSSVGISNDWPPMEWSRSGDRMQAFFRTICWSQYQDLTGAELAIRLGSLENEKLDFLIARSVMLSEKSRPQNSWYIQNEKYQDHPVKYIAKLDCARFMVEEAVWPTLHKSAVVVGGMPKEKKQAITVST